MNFGFVKAALKGVGRGALWTAENVGPAAATAFGGPLAGQLAGLAVQGIIAAQAKHGPTVRPDVVADPTAIGTGLAKKIDVMQFLESQAGTIAALVLSATGKPVSDPERFAVGVDKMVEGLVDVLKATGGLPVHTPPSAEVLPKSPDPIPVPVPVVAAAPVDVPVVFNGLPVVVPQAQAKPDVIELLRQVLTQLAAQKAAV